MEDFKLFFKVGDEIETCLNSRFVTDTWFRGKVTRIKFSPGQTHEEDNFRVSLYRYDKKYEWVTFLYRDNMRYVRKCDTDWDSPEN